MIDGGFLISILATLILLSQLIVMRNQHRTMEIGVLNETRSRWRELRSAWLVTLGVGGSMYVYIDESVIDDFPTARVIRDAFEGFAEHVYRRVDTFKNGAPDAELQGAVRDTLEYLTMTCGLILRGYLSPGLAYEILGISITKNGGVLRRFVEEPGRSDFLLVYYPGMATRLRILVDVLWVEAVRAKDLDEHLEEKAITAKREHGTGPACRRRAWREARRLAGVRRALAIAWHLTDAEIRPNRHAFLRRIERMWRFAFVRS